MLSTATILTAYIRAGNARTRAWVDAGDDRWATTTVEDAAHWARYGVYTIAQYHRFGQEQYIWDLYKDVYNVRPRGLGIADMTDVELDELGKRLQSELDIELAQAREQAAQYEEEEREYARQVAQIEAERDGMTLVSVGGELTAVKTPEDIAEDYYARKGW